MTSREIGRSLFGLLFMPVLFAAYIWSGWLALYVLFSFIVVVMFIFFGGAAAALALYDRAEVAKKIDFHGDEYKALGPDFHRYKFSRIAGYFVSAALILALFVYGKYIIGSVYVVTTGMTIYMMQTIRTRILNDSNDELHAEHGLDT